MTFEEIEQSLPNGFHDARLLEFSLDTVGKSATVRLSLHASVEGDSDREVYRTGDLTVRSVSLFFVEPPDAGYDFALGGKGIAVSGDPVLIGQNPAIDPVLSMLPSGLTAYRFFLEDWNSFLYICAADASFSWA
jgi:hypothetical protein